MKKIKTWFQTETTEKITSIIFLIIVATLLAIDVAHAQKIITYYPSCDSCRLTASPSSPTYLWSNGETTQRIYLTNTNPNMTISVVTSSGIATINEPALPAITMNAGYYQSGQTWTLVDWNYQGEWAISYYKGKNLLNPNAQNALQWMVTKAGTYTIKEQRGGCIVKQKVVVQ